MSRKPSDFGTLKILVNQLLFVQPAQCRCKTDSEAQKLRQLHGAARNESIESFAARIFKDERRLPASL